jgi:hypothetical protein
MSHTTVQDFAATGYGLTKGFSLLWDEDDVRRVWARPSVDYEISREARPMIGAGFRRAAEVLIATGNDVTRGVYGYVIETRLGVEVVERTLRRWGAVAPPLALGPGCRPEDPATDEEADEAEEEPRK